MRVLLLDCYTEDTPAADYFLPLLEADVDVVWLPREPLVVAPTEVDAVVVTGSKASANDDEPWIHGARAFLTEALAADVPVLGVCFGHQLLATAAGGTVRQRPEPEVGFLPVQLDPHPLFDGLGPELLTYESHGDEVAPGPAIQVLGRSRRCEVQALQVPGKRAWGVQFHLEYDHAEQLRVLLYRAEAYPELALDVEAEMARRRDTRPDARRLFARFLALAQ